MEYVIQNEKGQYLSQIVIKNVWENFWGYKAENATRFQNEDVAKAVTQKLGGSVAELYDGEEE